MMQDDAVLDRIGALADDLKLANLRPQISACRSLLHNGDSLDVAVFGRFKSGKSSLLNHIAGRDVLPIGVVPLTAVITRLRYGKMVRAEVRFLDGRAREIPIGEVDLYVSERENPDNKRRVAAVDIELPSLERFDPLRFVDTPGLGSAFAHNTAAALQWLPNVGAALVAVSADAPLSERDLALLADLRRHTPSIILLLTKADLLNSAQRVEVRSFVNEQFHRQDGHPPAVYFYSVMPALTELSVKFEQEILLPMRRDRGETSKHILRHKVNSLVSQALDYARVALAAATQVESARVELRNRLAAERQQFELLRAELGGLARQWIANSLDGYLVALGSTEQELEARTAAKLRAQFPNWRVRLPEFLRLWREWLQEYLLRELADVSRKETVLFCAPLQMTQDHLVRALQAFHDRLVGHVQAALGLGLPPYKVTLAMRTPGAPPIEIGFAFDATFEIVAPVLPLALIRPLIERSLCRKTRYEVEKNISRLASAWRDSVAAEVEALIQQAEEYVGNELTTLEHSLIQAPSSAPRLIDAITYLDSCRVSFDNDSNGTDS
jgi:GTP-binding protein EngB required for normal cell division